MTPKERELVAIGISLAAGCKPCTDHHVKVARKARATDDEIRQVMDDALGVRRRAVDIMEAYALAHLGEKPAVVEFGVTGEPGRLRAMVSVGAAFAVNCVTSLEHHLTAAGRSGVSQDDLWEIAKLATFIMEKAASHVERLAGLTEAEAT